jgi:hypothetical protein
MNKFYQKLTAVIVIIFILLSFKSMSQDIKPNFTIKSVKDCLDYLKPFKINPQNRDSKLFIPGYGGLVYTLPNGEIILIPTDTDLEYSGFIFPNLNSFKEIVASGYFPVPEEQLTSWEIERFRLIELPKSISFYQGFLKEYLGDYKFNINIKDELNVGYEKLLRFIKSKDHSKVLKERVVLSFSLVVMDQLVTVNKGCWHFDERFEIYNSYPYPYISVDDETKDIINELYISIEDSENNFRTFYEAIFSKEN